MPPVSSILWCLEYELPLHTYWRLHVFDWGMSGFHLYWWWDHQSRVPFLQRLHFVHQCLQFLLQVYRKLLLDGCVFIHRDKELWRKNVCRHPSDASNLWCCGGMRATALHWVIFLTSPWLPKSTGQYWLFNVCSICQWVIRHPYTVILSILLFWLKLYISNLQASSENAKMPQPHYESWCSLAPPAFALGWMWYKWSSSSCLKHFLLQLTASCDTCTWVSSTSWVGGCAVCWLSMQHIFTWKTEYFGSKESLCCFWSFYFCSCVTVRQTVIDTNCSHIWWIPHALLIMITGFIFRGCWTQWHFNSNGYNIHGYVMPSQRRTWLSWYLLHCDGLVQCSFRLWNQWSALLSHAQYSPLLFHIPDFPHSNCHRAMNNLLQIWHAAIFGDWKQTSTCFTTRKNKTLNNKGTT